MSEGFEVTDYIEHEDGSATLFVDMSYEMLIVLARKGMKALIEEAKIEYGYPYAEGSGDGYARGSRDQDLFGEIPGL